MECSDKFDITGRIFGMLTALKCVEGKRSKAKWECECACGKIKIVSYHDLVYGCIKSCGCTRGKALIKDLTGQKFGRLTAVERTEEKKGSSYVWRCRCECGNEVRVSSNALLSGNTQSCGCLLDEAKRKAFHNIAGQKFGRLVALHPVEKRSGGSVVWKCRCDCGRESEHPVKSLLEGRALSCRCLKSENDALQRTLHYIDGTCIEFIENAGKLRSDNTSGYPGLKYVRGKWTARITFKKKTYHLGTYEDKEDAICVRKEAEQRLFGEFLDWYYSEYPAVQTKKNKACEKEKSHTDD